MTMNGAAKDLKTLLGNVCVTDEASRISRVRDSWPQTLSWSTAEILSRLPLAVVLPESEKQVSSALTWAARQGVSIIPRGAGSGVLGAAAVPDSPAVVLDLSRLCSRFELSGEPEDPIVTVAAGTLGGTLEAKLNSLGYSLLHFPASLDVSTVGGWVATRSFGQLSTLYGGIERQARSLRVASPGGDIGAQSPNLHIGAEGTLGVITEVSLRVRRAPRSRDGAALLFPGIEEALAYCRGLWGSSLERPAVLRLYGPIDALASLRGSSGRFGAWRERAEPFALRHFGWLNRLGRWAGRAWTAVLIYEDKPQVLDAARTLPGHKPLGVSSETALTWWQRRYHWSLQRLKSVFERGCFADTMDLWGRWEILPALERGVTQAIGPHAFVMSHMAHFDGEGACLYVTFAGAGKSAIDGAQRHREAWRAGLDACVALGGKTNHHHGVGLAKLPWIFSAVDAKWYEKIRLAKRAADPKGLLNPGKLCL